MILSATRKPHKLTEYAGLVLRDGPVVYYRMDDTAGTQVTDLSPNRLHGTINGGVTRAQPGATHDGNFAMAFDGNSGYINVPLTSTTNIPSTAPMTIEAWVYPFSYNARSAPSGQSGWCIAATNGTGNNQGWSWGLDGNGGLWWWPAPYADVRYQSQVVALRQWSHIVLVSTGSQVSFYVNGRQIASAGNSGQGASNERFWVGGCGWVNGWTYGLIDEFALYARALTAQQVMDHYNAGRMGARRIN